MGQREYVRTARSSLRIKTKVNQSNGLWYNSIYFWDSNERGQGGCSLLEECGALSCLIQSRRLQPCKMTLAYHGLLRGARTRPQQTQGISVMDSWLSVQKGADVGQFACTPQAAPAYQTYSHDCSSSRSSAGVYDLYLPIQKKRPRTFLGNGEL